MYCSKCGKETSDGSSFCAACGNNLAGKKQSLYDLKPKKTAWQAILLYLSALAIEFLCLILLIVTALSALIISNQFVKFWGINGASISYLVVMFVEFALHFGTILIILYQKEKK